MLTDKQVDDKIYQVIGEKVNTKENNENKLKKSVDRKLEMW